MTTGYLWETARHFSQIVLLIETLQHRLSGRDAFVAGNMFLYFSIERGRPAKAVGPDVFVALDVPSVRERERKSWLVWKEHKVPDVVIELLSDSTAAYDRTDKKFLYQDEMQVPEYFYADPFSDEIAGFELIDGQYRQIVPDAQGRLVSKKLGLALGLWYGTYSELASDWWRFYTLDGEAIPTPAEAERGEREAAQQQAEQAQQQAEQAQQHAAELEALLARYKAQFGDIGEASPS